MRDNYCFRPPNDRARDLMMAALEIASRTATAQARATLYQTNSALLAEYLDDLREPARSRARRTILELRQRAAELHEALRQVPA